MVLDYVESGPLVRSSYRSQNHVIPGYGYEQWKKEASQFMNDIRNGLKTYEEFDKWLDKNK